MTLREFVQTLFAVFGGGLAAYIAIRVDITHHAARLLNVEKSTDKAHERLDSILMERRK